MSNNSIKQEKECVLLLHLLAVLRWKFIKENNKVKKERKHAFDQEKYQEKKKVFRLKNINQFYFQPLIIVSVICRFHQIEYI